MNEHLRNVCVRQLGTRVRLPEAKGNALSRTLARLVAYATVGATATAIQYAVLVLAVQAWHVRAVVGSTIGFVVSVGVNYLLNYHFTFRSRAPHRRAATRFLVIALAGLALNAAVMALLTEWLAIGYLLAQLVATALVFVLGFIANTQWSFAGGRA
jgi:putative flippase GtrA